MIALPAMLRRGYEPKMSMGVILAGGALGQLIPPSVLGIVYSGLANVSIGQIFLAGIIPGLLLALLFCIYVLVRCWFDRDAGPALSQQERDAIGWRDKVSSVLGVMPAILLVMTVLGVMFLGIAGPTEAAAVGALGSMVLAWWRGSLDLPMVRAASNETLKATTMILWIALSSLMFVSVYAGIGGDKLVQSLLVDLDVPPVAVLSIMMVIIFLLGTVMDPHAAWLLMRGIRTLGVRVRRQAETALALARRLAEHPRVESVAYPFLETDPGYPIASRQMAGGGGVVSFAVRGGTSGARRFADALELIPIATSLGGVETIVELPYDLDFGEEHGGNGHVAASPLGGTIRMSVGLEDVRDLWADLVQALHGSA